MNKKFLFYGLIVLLMSAQYLSVCSANAENPENIKVENTTTKASDELVEKGYALYKNGKLDEALNCFDEALALDKSNMGAYQAKVMIHIGRNNFDAAIAECNKAIADNPNDTAPYFIHGYTMIVYFNNTGNEDFIDSAVEDYAKCFSLSENPAETCFSRSLACSMVSFSLDDEYSKNAITLREKAENYIIQSLKLDNNNAEAHCFYGYIKIMDQTTKTTQKTYKFAIDEFNKSLAIKPTASAYNCRGVVYAKKFKKFDSAIEDFTNEIKILRNDIEILNKSESNKKKDLSTAKKDLSEAYIGRAFCYLQKKNYRLALRDYNSALKENPENHKAYNNRGIIYAKQGEWEKALSDFKTALELNSEYKTAKDNLNLSQKKASQNKFSFDESIYLQFRFERTQPNNKKAGT